MTQQEALNILKAGANVFLTGEPGSGKTHTINSYVDYLRSNGINPAITASTGIAATHLNGMTIHSWSGIGISRGFSKEDLDRLSDKKKLISRIRKNHILIIDEISMLDADSLDLVEQVCRTLKENDLPWGGMQVVFVGDFFQLPPVRRYDDPPVRFAFESYAWQSADPVICYIQEQYRQDDKIFLALLNSIRKGEIQEQIHGVLDSRIIDAEVLKNDCTKLFSHNMDVDRVNNEKLNEIPELEEVFYMEGRGPKELVSQLKRGCLSPEVLRLKVGAKVMFTKNNFEEGYVNGTLGKVEEFSENNLPIIRTSNDKLIEVSQEEWIITDGSKTLAQISQIPLRLAWAITVHKSQGMTLDSAYIDLSSAFEYGQGYVALSRIKTLEGLYLCGYNQKSLQVHPKIIGVDENFKSKSENIRQKYFSLSNQDLENLHQNFIKACGGSIGEKVELDVSEQNSSTSSRRKKNKTPKTHESTYEKTLALWQEGKSVDEIAQIRDITRNTVISHLEELYIKGKIGLDEIEQIASPYVLDNLYEIKSAFEEVGGIKLTPVFEKFGGKFTYEDLRIARIILSNREE